MYQKEQHRHLFHFARRKKHGISLSELTTLFSTAVSSEVTIGSNTVHSFGKNKSGQLGQGDRTHRYYPTLIKFGQEGTEFKVKTLAAGEEHSCLITIDGTVYSWGNNAHGQLGYNFGEKVEPSPKKIEAIPKMMAASCGRAHTLFLTSKGEIYACGANSQASLAVHNQKDKVYSPTKIEMDVMIKEIYASDFSAALTDSGDLYLWGFTPFGLITSPEKVEEFANRVQAFGIGYGFMILMDTNNRFHSVGTNEHGELGLGNTFEREGWMEIESLAEREVKLICCGYHHVANSL